MLIEAASTRLAIDLLESLKKFKLNATNIKVSYITRSGNTSFKTFDNLDSLKSYYTANYNVIVSVLKDPFTTDPNKAQLTPSVKNGIILVAQTVPLNNSLIPGACSIGKFLSVESFELNSTTFNYGLFFKCIDVSENYKIIQGVETDIRRNDSRQIDLTNHTASLNSLILDYQKILVQLYKTYTDNLYVDLCYVDVGYVKESIAMYNIFFALVKERLDAGLRLSVLTRRYLKKVV